MSSTPEVPDPTPIPYGRQTIDQADIDAVAAVLGGDWLTQGPAVERFEARLCDVTEAAHAVAFTSGTAALHAAAAVAGLGPGDTVATSALTFSASAACARYVGATPTLVDLDPATLNLDVARVPDGLDALVAVHYAGLPVDLAALAHRPPVVIEDAAHALGAHTPDGPVGNCAHSDLACFSFHPVKPITTAEGGLATTNDPVLAERMGLLRSHGVTRDPALMTHESDGPWYYQQVDLGWNYRMTEMQAALGLSQMARLDQFIDRRNALADRYDSLLADLPLQIPGRTDGARSAWHLYVIRLDDAAKHREVFEYLRANGIGVNLHYIPVHTQPYYRDLGHKVGDFPASEEYYSRAISIPLYAGMSDVEQDEVVQVLSEALSQ